MISFVILAAGQSSRLGSPKQLVTYKGKTLIRHTIDQALQVSEAVNVVLGANREAIEYDIQPYITEGKVIILENNIWQEGMASSVRMGTKYAQNEQASHVLFLLSDQPFVSVALLTEILTLSIQQPTKIIASDYGDEVGVPMLLPHRFFSELLTLQGDKGAKKILMQYPSEVLTVSFPLGLIDIDTPEDVRRLSL
jgi:molybdenum cofactor cytidylyltransferase